MKTSFVMIIIFIIVVVNNNNNNNNSITALGQCHMTLMGASRCCWVETVILSLTTVLEHACFSSVQLEKHVCF